VGLLPGPGNGVQMSSGPHRGRIFFAGHYETAERSAGMVVVYYSDDGGKTFALTPARFPYMDESNLAIVNAGGEQDRLVISMRNDPAHPAPGTGNASMCHCRAMAHSDDAGASWSGLRYVDDLKDPICEGSIASAGGPGKLMFSNPPMTSARANLSIHFSSDSASSWPTKLPLADSAALSDYSSLVVGPVGGKNGTVGGVLWGSCSFPIPFRPWCVPLEPLGSSGWNIYFTKFPLP